MKTLLLLFVLVAPQVSAQNVFNMKIDYPLGIQKWKLVTTKGYPAKDHDCTEEAINKKLADWNVVIQYPCRDSDAAGPWIKNHRDELLRSIRRSQELQKYLYGFQQSAKVLIVLVVDMDSQFKKTFFVWDLSWRPAFVPILQQLVPEQKNATGQNPLFASLSETLSHEFNHVMFGRYGIHSLDSRDTEAIAWSVGVCGLLVNGNLNLEGPNTPSFKKWFKAGLSPEDAFAENPMGKNFLVEYGKDNRLYENLLGYVYGRWALWRIFGTELSAEDTTSQKNLLKYCHYLVNRTPTVEELQKIDLDTLQNEPEPPSTLLPGTLE